MRYQGRTIDPVGLWASYVSFPHNMRIDGDFLAKVQCPNPNHDTTKQHFQINVNQPTVHCFAVCGISGSYEHAICLIEGLYEKFKTEEATDERERKRRRQRARNVARKIILGHRTRHSVGSSRAVLRKRKPVEILRPTDALEYETFIPQVGREFLEARGVTSESVSKWELGWLPEERRIVIPAKDFDGRLKLLVKRAVRPQDHPKYLYTEGVPKTSLLFGSCYLDMALVRSWGLVIVEGSLDTIQMQSFGIPTAGILGTGISEAQVRVVARLRPKKIFLMFDRDLAGVHNIQLAAKRLRKYPMYVCKFPKGKYDPAELTEKEAIRSTDRAVPLQKWMQQNFPESSSTRRKVQVG